MLIAKNSGNKRVNSLSDITSQDILLAYKDSKFIFERAKNNALSFKEGKGLVVTFLTGDAGNETFSMSLSKDQSVIKLDIEIAEQNAVHKEKNKYVETFVKVKNLKEGDLVLFRQMQMSRSVTQAYKIISIVAEVDKTKKISLTSDEFIIMDNLITKF